MQKTKRYISLKHNAIRISIAACFVGLWTVVQGASVPTQDVSANPADASRQAVGLVLSGGGAKGIAHIGVIQALEENDIPIDYVSGTSMGAIVGGLYAAGYTPQEMMELLTSPGFSYWSSGKTDPAYVYYFSRDEPTSSMLTIPVAPGDSTARHSSVAASLISPLPMNFAFMELFAPYTAQCGGNFDRLFVPFRCVASDVEAQCKVVHSDGSLGDAIRTSMTFPIVFQPIRVDGRLLYDGGIFDNFPVDVMSADFAPDIILGVDVSTPASGPQTSLMDQIDKLVMHRQDYSMDPARGIKVKVDLHNFGLLDWEKARQIYRIGYDTTMSMMDSIKGRIHTRVPSVARQTRRTAFKAATPELRFDSISVNGGTPRQNAYIEYVFRGRSHEGTTSDTISVDRAREAFYRAISPGRLRDLSPHAVYNDSTGLFAMDLRAAVRNNINIGVGGYLTSSTNNYIFAEIDYKTMSYSGVNAGLDAWLGQSYLAAQAKASLVLKSAVPSSLGLDAVVSRSKYYESEHLFYQTDAPTFNIHSEYMARLHWDFAATRRGRLSLGVGYGYLRSSFYRNMLRQGSGVGSYMDDIGRDRSTYSLGQALIRFTANSLDNIQFPTDGSSYDLCAMGVLGRQWYDSHDGILGYGERETSPQWLQLGVRTANYWSLGRHVSLGLTSDLLLSTRKLSGVYSADIADAPSFVPTAATAGVFNPTLRATSYLAAGLVPVYKVNSALSARVVANVFAPLRPIEQTDIGTLGDGLGSRQGGWFDGIQFFGEAQVSYALPFATIAGYANYVTGDGAKRWNVGLSFGFYLPAPTFLR